MDGRVVVPRGPFPGRPDGAAANRTGRRRIPATRKQRLMSAPLVTSRDAISMRPVRGTGDNFCWGVRELARPTGIEPSVRLEMSESEDG